MLTCHPCPQELLSAGETETEPKQGQRQELHRARAAAPIPLSHPFPHSP